MQEKLAELVANDGGRCLWLRLPLTWPASRSARWGARRSSLSLNTLLRTNWRQRSCMGKAIRDYVAIALLKEGIRVRPLIRHATLAVRFFHRRRCIADQDNHAPKLIADALIGRVIEDDRAAWLRIAPVEFTVDARDPRIEVEVREGAPSPSPRE